MPTLPNSLLHQHFMSATTLQSESPKTYEPSVKKALSGDTSQDGAASKMPRISARR